MGEAQAARPRWIDRSALVLLSSCALAFVMIGRDGERSVINQAVGHHMFLLGLWGVGMAAVLALVLCPPSVWRPSLGSLELRLFVAIVVAWVLVCAVFNATLNTDDPPIAEDVLGSLFGWMLLEELLFRGALFDLWDRVFPIERGRDTALIATSVLFGLAHLQYFDFDLGDGWFTAAYAIPSGLLFGYVRRKSGSIWPAVVLHGLANLVTTIVWILVA